MNTLRVGFSRVNITPPLGIPIIGYYKDRIADGVLDELEINAIAVACGEEKAVLMSVDHLGLLTPINNDLHAAVSEATGLPIEAIYIHSTHTHTGPMADPTNANALNQEYVTALRRKTADAAVLALADLKPARMGWAVGTAPNIAFIRRFRMKDGSVRTNPGVGNPEIDHPISSVDERVNVLRFDREGGKTIVLANFGCHPDTVGGSRISADWCGFFRRRTEQAFDNVNALFFNGAQGDVNHVNVNAKDGDLNDMFMDFDDVARGYGHARHMGNVVAGAVLQVFDKVNYVDVDSIRCIRRTAEVPSNMPDPADLPRAHEINALHLAGHDDQLPYQGMMLTTVVAEAARMVRLEKGPASFPMPLGAIAIGNVAFFGVPGECFTGVGRGLKEAEGWDLVLPTINTNGKEGYFPMMDAYEEGGYEAKSSNYKAGVAEFLIDEGKKMLAELRR